MAAPVTAGDREPPVSAWSIEATRPNAAELEALRVIAPGRTAIYLSAVPNRPHAELIATAGAVAAAGFEPVPHVAARGFASAQELDTFLDGLTAAAVRCVLVIGGDVAQAGPFGRALDVIASGRLQRHGIAEIGLAAYPDGHPRIPAGELEHALRNKLHAAQATDLRVHIVTQFCFDPTSIVAWIRGLRRAGIMVPVRFGVLGPTSLPTLLRYAQRCGVRASARGLTRSGVAKALMSDSKPDPILAGVLQAGPEIGDIAPHFFSFGGLVRTATYATTAAAQLLQFNDRDRANHDAPVSN